jgi:predicted permease
VLSILPIVFLFLWGWVSFHCAYKKRGTKWLTYLLIFLPIGVLRSVIQELGASLNEPTTPFFFLFLVTHVALATWFWVNCLRLRRENLLLQAPPIKT